MTETIELKPDFNAMFNRLKLDVTARPLIKHLETAPDYARLLPDDRKEAHQQFVSRGLQLFNGFCYAATICAQTMSTVEQIDEYREVMSKALADASAAFQRSDDVDEELFNAKTR